MRKPVQLLDSATVNQIAAGEVIENAVSVVKELVENSLDAEADEISIETLGGGQGLIVVQDNGGGMTLKDALMALQRHATSKIDSFFDIFSLHSFGFRGEALPAIASIAKIEIETAVRGEVGTRIEVHGGKVVATTPTPREFGTSMTIRSLFYNVPVRRDFQKSPLTDRLALRKLLENFVLSTEGVGWSWVSEGKEEFRINARQNLSDRVAFVMGEGFVQEALVLDRELESVRCVGFLGNPGCHRPNRQGQRIFINDRPVESSFISKKMSEAYAFLLPPQRYPVFVLKIYLPPQWCDFNVHPQKIEVRILKEKLVGRVISTLVTELLACPLGLVLGSSPREQTTSPCLPPPPLKSSPSMDMVALPTTYSVKEVVKQPIQMEWSQAQIVRLLTVMGRVLLAEDTEGVYAIDTRAARKQLLFLALQRDKFHYQSQLFLVPVRIEVTPQEGVFFASHLETLITLGFEISQMSPTLFSIESAPAFIQEEELVSLLLAMIAEGSVHSYPLEELLQLSLTKSLFSNSPGVFHKTWLELLWSVGKPERAFDGSRIFVRLSEASFLEET